MRYAALLATGGYLGGCFALAWYAIKSNALLLGLGAGALLLFGIYAAWLASIGDWD